LQADLSKDIKINYEDKNHFSQLIWAGIRNFDLTIGNLVHNTGVDKVNREEIPDFKEDFDQFIIRCVKRKNIGGIGCTFTKWFSNN